MRKPRFGSDFGECAGPRPLPRLKISRSAGTPPAWRFVLPTTSRIILDAGSGIRNLGQSLMKGSGRQAHQHPALPDPFPLGPHSGHSLFRALYGPKNRVSFYTGVTGARCRRLWKARWRSLIFRSISIRWRRSANSIPSSPAARFAIGGLKVIPFPLNHPQNASGTGSKSAKVIVYATDYEHGHPSSTTTLRDYAQGRIF